MADTKIKRGGLGRGLSALLSDASDDNNNATQVFINTQEILLDQIEVNPFQPRNHFDEEKLLELAESIKKQGIIQPITVRKLAENKFQIIAGERRFRATKIANLTSIPAYVREANDEQMLEMGLVENIQRENLNPIEIALSYQRMITECSLKQDE